MLEELRRGEGSFGDANGIYTLPLGSKLTSLPSPSPSPPLPTPPYPSLPLPTPPYPSLPLPTPPYPSLPLPTPPDPSLPLPTPPSIFFSFSFVVVVIVFLKYYLCIFMYANVLLSLVPFLQRVGVEKHMMGEEEERKGHYREGM